MQHAGPAHRSTNCVQGSLAQVSLPQILAECHAHLVTGIITVRGPAGVGTIELRAGAVERALCGAHRGRAAIETLTALREGVFEISQRLPVPDDDGRLAPAAELRGELGDLSLADLLRYCEDHALCGTITLIQDFDRGQIELRAGEIVSVELNGHRDEEHLVDLMRRPRARFRIQPPPLALQLQVRPRRRRRPTEPLRWEPCLEITPLSRSPRPDPAGAAAAPAHPADLRPR
jgi:hypothetical protein